MRTVTRKEWEEEGTRLFGPDKKQWRFVCPACGHVAAVHEWLEGGSQRMVACSCIGRLRPNPRDSFGTGHGPCNYAGGGLIGLNPVEVVDCGGESVVRLFEFDKNQESGNRSADVAPCSPRSKRRRARRGRGATNG